MGHLCLLAVKGLKTFQEHFNVTVISVFIVPRWLVLAKDLDSGLNELGSAMGSLGSSLWYYQKLVVVPEQLPLQVYYKIY